MMVEELERAMAEKITKRRHWLMTVQAVEESPHYIYLGHEQARTWSEKVNRDPYRMPRTRDEIEAAIRGERLKTLFMGVEVVFVDLPSHLEVSI